MSKPKRLFLIAGYDKEGIIDESLIYQVSSLSKLGDTILVMDNYCEAKEISKINQYVLFALCTRHGEYDFGSYKRAYQYAKEQNILKDYDYVYMVNDSVYGPLYELKPYLEKLESKNTDAFGLVYNPNKHKPHIQSWFIGMKPRVFLSSWFDTFITSVSHQKDKSDICTYYELPFTSYLIDNDIAFSYLYKVKGRGVYNKIKYLYKKKMPFIKKAAFYTKQGYLGRQILYVLNHIPSDLKNSILKNANRVYGEKYINWLLTKNPIRIMYRSIHRLFRKLFIEGI